MNLDDESLLSAYLDDELAAPGRAEVEAALRSDPGLRRRLADLAAARDLVSGLSRPAAPADLSAAILARLAAGRVGHVPATRRPRRAGLLILAGVTSLAASLMIARVATVPTPARPGAGFPPLARNPVLAASQKVASRVSNMSGRTDVLASSGAPVAIRRVPAPLAADKSPAPPASPTPLVAAAAQATARVEAARAVPPSVATREAGLSRNGADPVAAAEIRALLSRPGVRRLTVTVDVLDDEAIASMDGLVGNLHKKRPRWGQVRVEQTVLLDSDRPGRAVIYAMVLDHPEREALDQKLLAQYPKRIQEDQVPPALAETLAGSDDLTGHFAWHQGPAVAGLKPAPPDGNPILGLRTSPDLAQLHGPIAVDPPPEADRDSDKAPVPRLAEAAPRSTRALPRGGHGPSDPTPSARAVESAKAAANPPVGLADAASNSPPTPSLGRTRSGAKVANSDARKTTLPPAVVAPANLGEDQVETTMTVLIWLTCRQPGS